MKKVLAEISSKLRGEGVADYLCLGVTGDGLNFLLSKGDVGLLVGIAAERIFEVNPEKAMTLFQKILSDMAAWRSFNSERKVIH